MKFVNIIFIHNAGGSKEFNKHPAEYFKQNGCKVLNIDLLGHGENTKNRVAEYTVEQMALDIIAQAAQEKVNSAIIVGLNYGANVALEILKHNSSLLSHLVLMDPYINGELGENNYESYYGS